MSDDRRTRRRFLADALFAGGAVTAASVLGYLAIHRGPEVATLPTPTPEACTPRPDLRAAGEMEAPRPQPSVPPQVRQPEPINKPAPMHPGGAAAPPTDRT